MVAWFNIDKNRLIVADVITKAWDDSQYKSMFIAEPKRILREAGVDNIPETIEIQVLENTSQRQYIVFPQEVSTNDYNDLIGGIQNLLPLQPKQEIVLVQNTENLQFIILPIPHEDFLTESTLEAIHGGIPSVVSSQLVAAKQVLIATVAAVVTKTKVAVTG
ncbi:NHLP leader peptide family RiPP precursor [Nostoc sp.]|uniref:NHLP leader peptide family RiPP precursor n=1 Tax=Nostoc sp. TaxID=1180 RepID=UPI002FF7CC49